MLDFFQNTFNDREIALVIWVFAFIVVLLFDSKTRRELNRFLEILFSGFFLRFFSLIILYICLYTYFLYKLNYWNVDLLKDTILWTFGSGFIIAFNSVSRENKGFFKKLIFDNLKLIVLIQYLTNLYVFKLWIEISIFPIIIFLVLLNEIVENKEEVKRLSGFINFVLILIGTIYLFYSVNNIIQNFSQFTTISNLKSFLFPIIMTVLFVPFAYFIALYSSYETFIIRLKAATKGNKRLLKKTKMRLFWICNLSLSRIHKLMDKLIFFHISNEDEIKSTINLKV